MNATLSLGGTGTFWSVERENDANIVRKAFEVANISKIAPKQRTAYVAMQRVLQSRYPGHMIRPLAEKNGFEVLLEKPGKTRNQFDHVASAAVEPAVSFLDVDSYTGQMLKLEHGISQTRVDGDSLSSAMIRTVYHLNGTCLRPNGGLYWIPRDKVATWQALCSVLNGAGARGRTCTMMLNVIADQHMAYAVSAAVQDEILAKIAGIQGELEDEDLTERAIKHRMRRLNELHQKVMSYQEPLQDAVSALLESIDKVKEAASLAALEAAMKSTQQV